MLDLHYYTADTFARLDRPDEAEGQFREELTYFPRNTRARAGLATLYHSTDRQDEAESAIADMLQASPTSDAYALAARLWTSFGNPRQASAVRLEARRLFGAASAAQAAKGH